jgi:hypothetical protein
VEAFREAQPFEPVDEVVREEQELKVRLVGQKMVGRNFGQGGIALQFLDDQLDSRPVVVESPQVDGL